MRADKRRALARGVLFLYVLISATFSLAHRDYVPLEGRLFFCASNAPANNLDSSDNDFVCPAHNFAQSTHGPAASHQTVSSPNSFSFVRIDEHDPYLAAPSRNFSTRAPPQA